MPINDFYCKVYIETEEDRAWLVQKVAAMIAGAAGGRSVNSSRLNVDVSKNEDFDSVRVAEDGGFVYSRYYLDVVPANGVERREYIGSVGKLLVALWAVGTSATAACDFEDELPKRSQASPSTD